MYHSRNGASRFGRSSGFNRQSRPKSSFKPANLDRSMYINRGGSNTPHVQEEFKPENNFGDFGLHPQILSNVGRKGYEKVTPIQDKVIPVMMSGKDVVGLANTGTGKTAAFLLPLIHKVVNDLTQGVLILAPTRELAVQIFEEFRVFADGMPVGVCLCIGGMSMGSQMQRLRTNPHFVIGTPGRMKDLTNRGVFRADKFTNVVLDEVDRMLDIGFRKDIMQLISLMPKQRHAAFFSATVNKDAEEIMRALLTDPVKISVRTQETSHHIHQNIVKVQPGQNKVDVMHDLLKKSEFEKVIVFGRTKHGINKLEKQLLDRGLRVCSIHGNKTQGARQKSLADFKSGRVQALLATDIVARGIDVVGVTHVINFDEPASYEDYVHRIGRTGRAGKMGVALTLV